MITLTLLAALLIVVFVTARGPVLEALEDFFRGVRDLGLWGNVAVVGLFALAALSPLPVYAVLILASGFTWGWAGGALTAFVGATLWGMLFGVVVRFVAYEPALALVKDVRLLQAIDAALSDSDNALKFMILVRWTPAPFWVVNTITALTETPFWMYAVGFLAGETPNVVVLAAAGSFFSSIHDVFSGKTNWLQLTVLVLTIAIGIIIAPILAWYTRREFLRLGIDIAHSGDRDDHSSSSGSSTRASATSTATSTATHSTATHSTATATGRVDIDATHTSSVIRSDPLNP